MTWLRPDGSEMGDADWHRGGNHVLGMLIDGAATDEADDRGRPVHGDTMLLLLNGGEHDGSFALPQVRGAGRWQRLVDTADDGPGETHAIDGDSVPLHAYSLVLMRHGTERRDDLAQVASAAEARRSAATVPVRPEEPAIVAPSPGNAS